MRYVPLCPVMRYVPLCPVGAYAANLPYWKNLTNTWIPFVPALSSPIPGDPGDHNSFQSFRVANDALDIPDTASIADFTARWAWIVRRQLPAYQPWSNANPTIDIPKLLRGGYK